jgi:chromosome segregation ATPase
MKFRKRIISKTLMANVLTYVPRTLIFLAGVAAGALAGSRRERESVGSGAVQDLKRSIAGLEERLAAQESSYSNRLSQIETRLEEHATKLSDVPSTTQIVAAMEQLLSKTMMSLDERLTTQAHSIEVLKTTVSQTDSLLERVLESLDSLQSYTETGEPVDSLLERPAV